MSEPIDIFVSYSRKDVARARTIVAGLEAEGFSVWWDPKISVGDRWPHTLEDALRRAKAIVVLWTRDSKVSPHVIDEATQGLSAQKLAPVLLEPTELDAPFNEIEAAVLMDWKGDRSAPEWSLLCEKVSRLCNKPRAVPIALSQLVNAKAPVVGEPRNLASDILLLATAKTATEWTWYKAPVNHWLLLGLEYSPFRPDRVELNLLTADARGRIGTDKIVNGAATGRLKVAEIPLQMIPQRHFSVWAKFFVNASGPSFDYADALNADGNLERYLMITIDREMPSTSFINSAINLNNEVVHGAEADLVHLTAQGRGSFIEPTGRSSMGLILSAAKPTNEIGVLIWARQRVEITPAVTRH